MFTLAVALCCTPLQLHGDDASLEVYRATTARIITEATSNENAWNRLAELSDSFPARLSGSASLDKDGLENVRLEKVMVPHWVRGTESAEIVEPFPQPIVMAALGGSVGTPPEGVQAEAIVVKNYDDLEAQGAARIKGKIVVYNFIYRTDIDPLVAYREGTAYRGAGASRAAKLGAVGALVRSVGPTGQRTPHTGGMRYTNDAPQIPVAGISAEDADKLQRMQDRKQRVVVRMKLGAQTLPDVESANVIAELRGREKPDEVVLIAGHIDSWDLAAGAMDNGGGCVATWEALRVLKKLNLTPRRTIRVGLFVNEENGTRGGQAYREKYADQLAKHVLALESDNGVLPLKGWGFNGTDSAKAVVQRIASFLKPLGGDQITDHFDGADIQASVRAGGIPAISPEVDLHRYFFVHHTPSDTVDKIDPGEMARVVAAIASMAYVVAEMPQTLERSAPAPARGRSGAPAY
jgi:carboxypeptidase Q